MLTRRSFLKTTLAGTGALLGTTGGVQALALQSNQEKTGALPILIFSDENSALTSAFAGALAVDASPSGKASSPLHTTVSRIDRDVLRQTEELKTFCQNTPEGLLIGLTRDSDFFVLEHSAAQYGFTPLYKGIHDFRGKLMRHEITAPQPLATALAKTLAKAQDAWPQQLARVVPEFLQARGQAQSAEAFTAQHYQSKESGYLVSWVLKAV